MTQLPPPMDSQQLYSLGVKWMTRRAELRHEASRYRAAGASDVPGNDMINTAEAHGRELALTLVDEIFKDFGLSNSEAYDAAENEAGARAATQEHIQRCLAGQEVPQPGVFPGYTGGPYTMEALRIGAAAYQPRQLAFESGPLQQTAEPALPPGFILGANGRPIDRPIQPAPQVAQNVVMPPAPVYQQPPPTMPQPVAPHHPEVDQALGVQQEVEADSLAVRTHRLEVQVADVKGGIDAVKALLERMVGGG